MVKDQRLTHMLRDEFCYHFSTMAKQKNSSTGAFVPGLADRAGKRHITDPSGKKSGGARVRGTTNPLSVDILHSDLRALYEDDVN